MSSPFIGAYWNQRKESAESCAARLANLINKIGERHSLLRDWRKKGHSRTEALGVPVGTSAEEIVKLLRGSNSEVDGSVISDLGFNLSLWNGNEEHGISLTATCGAFSDFVRNCVVLQFSSGEDDKVFDGVDPESLLQDFVDALEPESAMLTSNDYINRNGGGAPWDAGGWIAYNRDTGEIVSSQNNNLGKEKTP